MEMAAEKGLGLAVARDLRQGLVLAVVAVGQEMEPELVRVLGVVLVSSPVQELTQVLLQRRKLLRNLLHLRFQFQCPFRLRQPTKCWVLL